MRIFVALLLAGISASSLAQTVSLDDEQKKAQLQHALDSLNELDASFQKLMHNREADCAKAVGYPPFCNCILKDLPVAWTFNNYVEITTKTKVQNGYSQLSADDKVAYDKVAPIRDACVKKINAKP